VHLCRWPHPRLRDYYDTIPTEICPRGQQDCQCGNNQVGQVAPPGACATCGSQYAVEPTWWKFMPTPWETTSTCTDKQHVEVEVLPTSTEAEALTITTSESRHAYIFYLCL
jgi:hypothetical protein